MVPKSAITDVSLKHGHKDEHLYDAIHIQILK